jgi:hypothetical protein
MMRARKNGQVATARKQAHTARSNENTMRKHLAQIAKERDRLASEISRMKPLVDAAIGLSLGDDWNNGTHAKIHRPRLMSALRALMKTPNV